MLIKAMVLSMSKACEIEANLDKLRFLQLGSILAPIKRPKSGRSSEVCFVESTDSSGRRQP
jgi:hypothetical protein